MYLTTFVSNVSDSICIASLYPYMKILDPSADTDFVGWIMAAFSIGQLLASPLFGIWSNRCARTREPLLVALTICILGSLLYMKLQSFRTAARPLIILARLLTGISGGCIAPIRSYVSGATTTEERTSAVAFLAACQIIAFITGPLIQTAMVPIGHPGIVDVPGFNLDMYTSAALFVILLSIINMILLITVFREHRIDDKSISTCNREHQIGDKSISTSNREHRINDKSISTCNREHQIGDKSISTSSREKRIDNESISMYDDRKNRIDDDTVSNSKRENRVKNGFISNSNTECRADNATMLQYNMEHQVNNGSISISDRNYQLNEESKCSIEDQNGASENNCRLDYLAIVSTLAIVFSSLFLFAIFETISTPMTMHMFGWTNAQGTLYVGIVLGVSGVVAIFVCVIVIILSKRFDERLIMLAGFMLLMVGIFGYLPWGHHFPQIQQSDSHTSTIRVSGEQTTPGSVIPVTMEMNASQSTIETVTDTTSAGTTLITSSLTTEEAVGCPSHYDWCHTTPALQLWQYCLATFILAIGYTAANVITMSIYSKILGPKPQGMWMGFMASTASSARALGPVFVSQIYDAYGPRITFGTMLVWILLTILGILLVFRRLVPRHIDRTVIKDHKAAPDSIAETTHL